MHPQDFVEPIETVWAVTSYATIETYEENKLFIHCPTIHQMLTLTILCSSWSSYNVGNFEICSIGKFFSTYLSLPTVFLWTIDMRAHAREDCGERWEGIYSTSALHALLTSLQAGSLLAKFLDGHGPPRSSLRECPVEHAPQCCLCTIARSRISRPLRDLVEGWGVVWEWRGYQQRGMNFNPFPSRRSKRTIRLLLDIDNIYVKGNAR